MIVWLAVALGREFRSAPTPDGFDTQAFGQLPVSYGGRFKPMDTVARNALTILSGKQTLEVGDKEYTASQWLARVLGEPLKAADYPLFRVDNPEVKAVVGVADSAEKRFSYAELDAGLPALFEVARQADSLERASRTAFQNEALELASNISLFLGFANHESIHLIPTQGEADWQPLHAHNHGPTPGTVDPVAAEIRAGYHALYDAYAKGDTAMFNEQVAQLNTKLADHAPAIGRKAVTEWHFNHFAPFTKAMVLYIAAGLLIFFSWLFLPRTLLGTALKLTVIALIVHTLALAVRVYLSGRPPVTNLYSSAVFIGWGVVLLSFLLEPLLKRGLGLIVGVCSGVATLLIAQGLSADGDTMAVLQAVLDTNFWLATHVIVITFGYTAAYVAGALGILYVLAGFFTKAIDRPLARRLAAAIYGTVCFAVLLSFIGTILGGIWADQSWGRFWGWDPKENGALMIVIWNAVILHCRWGHLVRERGLAILAILGNIVTSWSWFGTNLLGAGLHSYGFTEAGEGNMLDKLLNPGPKEWLLIFVCSQLLIVALGLLPLNHWRSFRRPAKSSGGQASAEKRKAKPATQPA